MRTSIMKKLLAIAGCVTLFCGVNVATSWAAQDSAAVNGTLVKALTIAKATGGDLAFGQFASTDGLAGTLQIDAAGVLTPSANVKTFTSTHSPAKFDITGEATLSYALTIPASVSLSDGAGHTLTVNNLSPSLATGTINAGSSTIPAGGSDTLTIGAIAQIGLAQASGTYTGTLTVQVNYN